MVNPSLVPADQDLEDSQPASNSLKFNEPLSWKPGKPIQVAVLIKRLSTLSKELSELEQEDVNRDSLATPAKELASDRLMSHKDEGVKAYTACCLADMLRLHAPDAPYDAGELRDIFLCFVSVLKGLEDQKASYYQQYIYLLDSLSTVKSVVLISDIPDSEHIILDLFTSFFDIAKPDGSKNVEYHMTDILIQLIDECNSLPTGVVDIIMIQFLRNSPSSNEPVKKAGPSRGAPKVDDKQTKLTSAVPPPAYNMAKAICNSCIDKMARHTCQYFSDVLLSAAPSIRRKLESPDADGEDDPVIPETSNEEQRRFQNCHLLAQELWKSCPQVLQNVIPLLEQELLADDGDIRTVACETIGEMALTGNFFSSAPATWKVWVSRANDKSPGVRKKWVNAAVRILKERNDNMAIHLTDLIAIKLNDLDETVRLEVCQSLRGLDYMTITTKLAADQSPFNLYDSTGSIAGTNVNRKGKPDADTRGWGKKILLTLAERVRDKKIHVRLEGMRCLARMWDMAYKDIASGNEVVFAQLGWIPSKILDTFYINDPEVNVLLDHVLHEILIPVNYPPIEKERYGTELEKSNGNAKKGKGKDTVDNSKEREKEVLEGDKIRVQRLLVLVKGLDTKAKRALFAVPLRQISYAKVMEVFLKACEDNNGGVIEEGIDGKAVETTLDKFSAWLSQKLPEPPKAKDNLQKFAKLHDRRCYQLIRFCFNPDSDYRTVVKALKEIKKRIGESSQPGILDSLTPLLYRVSQLIYNKSHVAPIVEFSRTDELALGGTAHEVLKEMSGSNPAVFKANVKALSDLLQEQSPTLGSTDSSGAVDTLKACAGFAKSYPKDMPQERKLLQALVSFALTGSPPAAAKHAVTILMYSATRKELYATDLVKRCIKDFKFGDEHFLAKLACLGQLVLLAPDQCIDDSKTIKDLVTDILVKVRTPKPADENDDDEPKEAWAEESELDPEIKAKLLALRVLVNRMRANTEVQSADNASVMKSLNQIVANEGEPLKTKITPATHRSRLRLAAAQHLLKLATHKPYDELISATEFNRLAVVAQDRCIQVRKGFVNKLKKYLAAGKLAPRYYTIVFLMAYEVDEDWLEEVVTWIRSRGAQLAKSAAGHNIMEGIFARLMSLLVHHPDFGTQVKDLTDFSKYIMFYLRTVANDENISLIHYVAQRAKQFRDRLSPENSDNLYYLSELSQAVIRIYADHHHWPIQTWPGKLRLPAALFAPMQTAAESQEVSNKTFLPEGMEKKLQALVRTSKTSASSSSAAVSSATAAGRKRKNDAGGANSATTPAKSKKAKAEAGTPKPKKPQPVRKRHAKSKLVTSPKTTTAAGPAEEMKPSERRRSGRQSTRVANYKEDLPSDDEGFEGEDDVSDVDQEMGDGTSSEQSESEHEFRPRRVSRGKTSVGGLARKLAVAATPKGKGKEKETDEMEVDGPEKDAEHENEEPAVAPVAPMASSAPTLQEEPTTLTVAVGRRPTRAAAGKAEASKSAPAPTRATRGAGKAVAAEDSDSSELSDVPDDVDEEEL